ncbi:UNVERIFIED_CONTAM: hypothetical protein FKN15_077985 [Acipenser sinensis]
MFGAAQTHGGVSLHFLVTELPKPIFEEAACRASDEAFEALGLATLRDDYDNGRPIRAKAYWYKRILPHPCGPHVNWLTVLLALGPHTPTTGAIRTELKNGIRDKIQDTQFRNGIRDKIQDTQFRNGIRDKIQDTQFRNGIRDKIQDTQFRNGIRDKIQDTQFRNGIRDKIQDTQFRQLISFYFQDAVLSNRHGF